MPTIYTSWNACNDVTNPTLDWSSVDAIKGRLTYRYLEAIRQAVIEKFTIITTEDGDAWNHPPALIQKELIVGKILSPNTWIDAYGRIAGDWDIPAQPFPGRYDEWIFTVTRVVYGLIASGFFVNHRRDGGNWNYKEYCAPAWNIRDLLDYLDIKYFSVYPSIYVRQSAFSGFSLRKAWEPSALYYLSGSLIKNHPNTYRLTLAEWCFQIKKILNELVWTKARHITTVNFAYRLEEDATSNVMETCVNNAIVKWRLASWVPAIGWGSMIGAFTHGVQAANGAYGSAMRGRGKVKVTSIFSTKAHSADVYMWGYSRGDEDFAVWDSESLGYKLRRYNLIQNFGVAITSTRLTNYIGDYNTDPPKYPSTNYKIVESYSSESSSSESSSKSSSSKSSSSSVSSSSTALSTGSSSSSSGSLFSTSSLSSTSSSSTRSSLSSSSASSKSSQSESSYSTSSTSLGGGESGSSSTEWSHDAYRGWDLAISEKIEVVLKWNVIGGFKFQ